MTATQPDPYLPQPATLARKEQVTELETLLSLRLDSGAALNHEPGQFIEVSLPPAGEAPISIACSADRSDGFELLVRRVGRVSSALHQLKPGDKVGVRGPFGTHFPVHEEMKGRDVVFIAGGIGLAPLRSAIEHVLNRRGDYGNVTILYGTKSPAERLFRHDLAAWAARKDIVFMETVDRADERWKGNVGVITTLIPKARIDPARAVIAACGPPIMYKFVIVSLFDAGVPDEQVFVSLERRMKCGIGKCGHCQINGLYACLDGPVFRYDRITSLQEAI